MAHGDGKEESTQVPKNGLDTGGGHQGCCSKYLDGLRVEIGLAPVSWPDQSQDRERQV
jgi:hypothetical protein